MGKLSLAARKMILVIIASALLIIVCGAVYYFFIWNMPADTGAGGTTALQNVLYFTIGVCLSSVLNIFKVYLLERNVKRILNMDDAGAGKSYISIQYLARYVLTGAVLVAAALIPFINIWGAIIGVLTMQVAVIAIRFMKIDEEEAGQ